MKISIYNTVDDVPVIQGVEKIVCLILSRPELIWGALIDAAFDYGRAETKLEFGSVVDCFDFPELRGLKSVGPRLLTLNLDTGLRTQLARLIKHCQGRPMLSFVGAPGSLNDINERWRTVHMVSVVDKQEMLLRFADTRILSYLPQVLTPAQWEAICGTVASWNYFDRSGRLVSCDIPATNHGIEKISVTAEQLGRFLDASHPDALIALLAESMADIIPRDSLASERHHMIYDSCELAKKYKITNNADILAIAVAAYLTRGKSNANGELELLLRQHSWSAGSLGDALVDAEII